MKLNFKFLLLFVFIIVVVTSFSQKIDPNGLNVFYHKNGKIASEGYMVNGQPEGLWKTYNEEGILVSAGSRKNNLLDSLWSFYLPNGELYMTMNYLEGKKEGIKTTYLPEKGKIIEIFKNDLKEGYERHYNNRNQLVKEIPFVNGLEEGIAKEFNDEGLIISILEYQIGYILKREYINRKDNSGLKQGIWKEFYENGKVKIEGFYLNGKKDGFFKYFNEDGNLEKLEKYINGNIIEGAEEIRILETRVDYYRDGKQKVIQTYLDNKPHGIRREYSAEGVIIDGYLFNEGELIGVGIIDEDGRKQGPWKELYEKNKLRAEGSYIDNQPVKSWKYYFPSGIIEMTGTFNNEGKKIGQWKWFYENGKILREENYENGKMEGMYVEFNEASEILSKGNFMDDKEEGPWIIHYGDFLEEGNYREGLREDIWIGTYDNGNKAYQVIFHDDNPDGKYLSYWPNGKVRESGTYILGRKHGLWQKFDENGVLYLTITYRKGVEMRYEGTKIVPELPESIYD